MGSHKIMRITTYLGRNNFSVWANESRVGLLAFVAYIIVFLPTKTVHLKGRFCGATL